MWDYLVPSWSVFTDISGTETGGARSNDGKFIVWRDEAISCVKALINFDRMKIALRIRRS